MMRVRFPLPAPRCADIAQLVEQRIRNAKVVGSTPIIGTIKIKLLRKILSFSHQKIILM